MVQVVSRNNIFHTRRLASARGNEPGLDLDFDLFSGEPPTGHERNGWRGLPAYAVPPALEGGRGVFWLSPQSPGFDAGTRLPGFNDGFLGRAPDAGAHEAGSPPMGFGPEAFRRPVPGR